MGEEKKPALKLKKRSGLGKGLSALLSDATEGEGESMLPKTQKKESDTPLGSISEILIEQIEVNPYQPRTEFDKEALYELADSIRLQGIIQPITVRKLNENSYQLISGERRTQASKIAGLDKIPAYIRSANDQQMLEMALIENIQRENLNPIEVALSYQRLMTECTLKQEELGERVGKKRATVTNYLRLLKLPPEIQASVRDKRVSMGHARALISIENLELQLSIYRKILEEGLSVRKVEELARQKASTSPSQNSPQDNAYKALQGKLSSQLGAQVKVNANANDKGEIKIPFQSASDLNRILEQLNIHL